MTNRAPVSKEEFDKRFSKFNEAVAKHRTTKMWVVPSILDRANTNVVRAELRPSEVVPSQMAVLINETNLSKMQWIPFRTNYAVTFDPQKTTQSAWFYFRWPNSKEEYGSGHAFHLDKVAPQLVITNMAAGKISQAVIYPEGYVTEDVLTIQCAVTGASGSRRPVNCFMPIPRWDTNYWRKPKAEKYFVCYDTPLEEGSNVVTFTMEDFAHNITVTNIPFILDLKSDRVPPKFTRAEARVKGDGFVIQGKVDDASVGLLAYITAEGKEQKREGEMGLRGEFEIGPMSFLARTNHVLIIATDSAGNVGRTNVTVKTSGQPKRHSCRSINGITLRPEA